MHYIIIFQSSGCHVWFMAYGMVRNVCFYYWKQLNPRLPFQYQTAIDLTITNYFIFCLGFTDACSKKWPLWSIFRDEILSKNGSYQAIREGSSKNENERGQEGMLQLLLLLLCFWFSRSQEWELSACLEKNYEKSKVNNYLKQKDEIIFRLPTLIAYQCFGCLLTLLRRRGRVWGPRYGMQCHPLFFVKHRVLGETRQISNNDCWCNLMSWNLSL